MNTTHTASNPTIVSAHSHYELPTVTVEPYRTNDTWGNEYEVRSFFQNGGLVSVIGAKIKKNGQPYASTQEIRVEVPQNVREALANI